MQVIARAALAASAVIAVSGCATMSQSSTQDITVLAYDQRDRPVAGMTCTLRNGVGEAEFSTPANKVTVRRSYADLEIECRRGNEVAKGTVVARRENLEQALVPFGWVAVGVDHLTGHLYAYPDLVRLRVGQHLRYEFSREARAAGLIATLGDGGAMAELHGPPARSEPLPPVAAPSRKSASATARPARPRAASAAGASASSTSASTTSASTASSTAAARAARTAPLTW